MRGWAAAVTVLAVLAAAAPASADSEVVSATIVDGSPGTPAVRTVSLSTMQACPAYTGPDTLELHPGGTDQLTTGTTWDLAEILSCGLQIPLDEVTAVEVQRGAGAAEAPLSVAQLTDPSLYHDPTAPGALPVISSDGGQALNIYTRPWRGGSDQNARDQVTVQGPIQLSVYEHSAPLLVDMRAHVVHRGRSATQIGVSATVRTAAGTTLPASALSWHWMVPGTPGSRSPTTVVTVPLRATTTVSVLVRDAADGSIGTGELTIANVPRHAAAAAHHGGGKAGTTVKTSGLGRSTPAPSHGTRRHGGRSGSAGSAPPSRSTTSPTQTHTSSATTTTSATTATTSATSPTTAATTTAPRPTPTRPHRRRTPRRVAPSRPRGQLVSGRLIGDLTLPPAATPAPTTPQGPAAAAAPDVAERFTVPGAILAGAIVVGLLGAGAGRERWARSRRLHR